jgi:hypothetical protein
LAIVDKEKKRGLYIAAANKEQPIFPQLGGVELTPVFF